VLELARQLYAEAYEPLRSERTLEALERQHTLLRAADALEKRAPSTTGRSPKEPGRE
jgi:hypothetical protein